MVRETPEGAVDLVESGRIGDRVIGNRFAYDLEDPVSSVFITEYVEYQVNGLPDCFEACSFQRNSDNRFEPANRGIEVSSDLVETRTTAKRSSFMPELPTVAESGLPGYDVSTWWGVLAAGKTPLSVVQRLNEEIRRIVGSEDVKARIVADGAEPVLDMSAERFNALLKNDIAKWRRIVKERNIQPN